LGWPLSYPRLAQLIMVLLVMAALVRLNVFSFMYLGVFALFYFKPPVNLEPAAEDDTAVSSACQGL